MPRILLANEFGEGCGHLETLREVGQAFGQGFQFDAALCRRENERVLYPLRSEIFNGACLNYWKERRTGPGRVPTATWGEYLGDLGFNRVQRIRDVVAWWRKVLSSRRVDLLIGEYAPLALLSARSLGIPTIAVGQGYGLPPADLQRFPLLDPTATVRLHDEQQLLENVNTVAAEVGLAPLAGLPEVYRATLTLVRTLPLLDIYRECRRSEYLIPLTTLGALTDGAGDEVFVYFSTKELQTPAVVEALERLPLPRRGYLPAVTDEVAQRLTASGMVLEPAPVPPSDIIRRSRLLLNAGQHGILSLGLFAGIAQVALPQYLEQLSNAQCAQAAGAACVVTLQERAVDHVIDTVRAAYGDAALQARALQLARELRAAVPCSPEQQLDSAVAPLRDALLSGTGRQA